MSLWQDRGVRSGVTLSVATLALALMAWVGVTQATKPLPKYDSGEKSSCSEKEITRTFFVKKGDIVVSVYNAGARKGFAGKTLERLEYNGFRPGALGNAPDGMKYQHTVVFTDSSELAPARLVAAWLGPKTQVEQTDEEYGPGIDVFVGSKQGGINRKAPKRMKLDEPVETCIRVD